MGIIIVVSIWFIMYMRTENKKMDRLVKMHEESFERFVQNLEENKGEC